MAGALTTANSVITLRTEALYTSAQRLDGYAADDIFDFAEVENGEYSMGIDGLLSAAFVFNELPLTMTFQANSPSLNLFENIYQYEVQNRTKLEQNVIVTLPSLGKRYELRAGFMRSYKAPSGKKMLQPAAVAFVFGRMEMSRL